MAKGASQGNPKKRRQRAARRQGAAGSDVKPEKNRARRKKAARAGKGRAAAKPARGKALAGRAAGDARLDRAVTFVNQRARAISAQIIAIGKYLLREFFDDDPAAVTSKDPGKTRSLRDLAARPDCVLSYSTLSRAVDLAIQERKLGTVAAPQQLTTSHKVELLAIEDLKEKQALAKQAAAGDWSTRELRTEIRRRAKVTGRKASKGRVAGGGEIALVAGSLKHVVKAAKAGAFSAERVAVLPKARLERLAALMEEVIGTLGRSVAVVRRAIGGKRAGAGAGVRIPRPEPRPADPPGVKPRSSGIGLRPG